MAASGGMVGGGVYQRVLRSPGSNASRADLGGGAGTIRAEARYPRSGVAKDRALYSRTCSGPACPDPSSATSGGPMPRDPDRILLRTVWLALHVRIGDAARAAALGLKVMSRGLKNFVLSDDTSLNEAMAAARSDTDRESDLVTAGRLPQDVQLLHELPAVHVSEMLERVRRAVPELRSGPRARGAGIAIPRA